MVSSMTIARARTVVDELLHWPEFKRARENAAGVWSALRPKLDLSGEMKPSKRQTRFARNILAAGLPSPARYLEIGSFEGGSLAFVHAVLQGHVCATVIDPFENYSELPSTDMTCRLSRFDSAPT